MICGRNMHRMRTDGKSIVQLGFETMRVKSVSDFHCGYLGLIARGSLSSRDHE